MKNPISYSHSRLSILGGFTLIVLFLAFTFSCTQTKYVGGIQINEADQNAWAKTLNSVGFNTAQVTAYAKQGAWNTDHLWWESDDTTHVINEINALKTNGIHVVLVLRVALQHEYEPNMFKWHGMIFPTSKKDRDEWFYRYNYFVEMWSKIGEREGVDVIAIASEMNALTATEQLESLSQSIDYFASEEKQLRHELKIVPYHAKLQKHDLWEYGRQVDSNIEQYILTKIQSNLAWTKEAFHTNETDCIERINADRTYLDSTWRAIIANSRKHYSGKLTMAANFDSYHEVSFWDELDFIGINAYFQLRKISPTALTDDAIYAQLVNGWENVFNVISTFKSTHKLRNKPLFFTEIGYTQKQDCTTAPWTGDGYSLVSNAEFDTLLIWKEVAEKPNERIMALNALYQVVKTKKIPLIGINYWKLTSHAYHRGYEPFMLYIQETEDDGLQSALQQFLVQ